MPPLALRHVFAAVVLAVAALAVPAELPDGAAPGPTESNVMCCDGTISPTCTVKKRGCCSHHGGVCE